MKPLHVVLILATIIILGGCKSKKGPYAYPDDFTFRLSTTSFDYDLQTQKYVYFDKTLAVSLTEREVKEIYEYARDIRFLNFPNEFKCDGFDMMIPCFKDRLEIRYNNVSKESVSDDCCSKIEKKRPEEFSRLVQKITDILDSKEEVKNLPKYEMMYM